MNLEIRKYDASLDYDNLMRLIQSEGEEWRDYLNPHYQKVLNNSIAYVAWMDEELCGFVRAINDSGLFIWVIDLLVHKHRRGRAIGKRLMEFILEDFPVSDVYVMSDVDGYYNRLGYKKEGSIFKVGTS